MPITSQSGFVVKTTPGRAAVVAAAIPTALDPGDPGHFSTNGFANLQNLRSEVSTSINGLLLALSVVFLCIAVLSTSSTMTNSVLQRTSEIGLRMATGSSPTKIAGLFLTEGTVLGLVGGLLGSTAGITAVLVTAIIERWTPALNPGSITLGIACGAASGLLAAIIPSIRASRTQPALAVRTGTA